jgi:hypothetical protein
MYIDGVAFVARLKREYIKNLARMKMDGKTKLQVTIGEDLTRYLEQKAQMMGDKPIATAALAALTEAMLRETPAIVQFLEMKKQHDTTD